MRVHCCSLNAGKQMLGDEQQVLSKWRRIQVQTAKRCEVLVASQKTVQLQLKEIAGNFSLSELIIYSNKSQN